MHRLARFTLFGLALLAGGGVGVAQAQSPAFTMLTQSIQVVGQSVSVDVYRPSEASPRGAAILAHGLGASRGHQRYLGEALATAGFIAIVPDLPDLLDPSRNANAIVSLAHMIESGAPGLGIPATPRDRFVLVGMSFGGLVTVLAAADLPGVGGWVGLDPVDATRYAARAAPRVTAPAIVFLGEPQLCNLYGNGSATARAVPSLLRATVVAGASHCDFEGPTNSVCRSACGHGSNAMRALVREEAVRAVAELLHAPVLTQTNLVNAAADSSEPSRGKDTQ